MLPTLLALLPSAMALMNPSKIFWWESKFPMSLMSLFSFAYVLTMTIALAKRRRNPRLPTPLFVRSILPTGSTSPAPINHQVSFSRAVALVPLVIFHQCHKIQALRPAPTLVLWIYLQAAEALLPTQKRPTVMQTIFVCIVANPATLPLIVVTPAARRITIRASLKPMALPMPLPVLLRLQPQETAFLRCILLRQKTNHLICWPPAVEFSGAICSGTSFCFSYSIC